MSTPTHTQRRRTAQILIQLPHRHRDPRPMSKSKSKSVSLKKNGPNMSPLRPSQTHDPITPTGHTASRWHRGAHEGRTAGNHHQTTTPMTDYDAPRYPAPDGPSDDTVSDLKTRRTERRSGATDIGEPGVARSSYFASLDPVGGAEQELPVSVQPKQHDEFTCTRCFLVQHRRRLAQPRARHQVCRDCQ